MCDVDTEAIVACIPVCACNKSYSCYEASLFGWAFLYLMYESLFCMIAKFDHDRVDEREVRMQLYSLEGVWSQD